MAHKARFNSPFFGIEMKVDRTDIGHHEGLALDHRLLKNRWPPNRPNSHLTAPVRTGMRAADESMRSAWDGSDLPKPLPDRPLPT
jgi:hypothetical protein